MDIKKDQAANCNFQLVRLKEVARITKLSRSSLWRAIRAGTFPAPRKIGKRAIAFRMAEIYEWVNTRQKIQLQKDITNNYEDK